LHAPGYLLAARGQGADTDGQQHIQQLAHGGCLAGQVMYVDSSLKSQHSPLVVDETDRYPSEIEAMHLHQIGRSGHLQGALRKASTFQHTSRAQTGRQLAFEELEEAVLVRGDLDRRPRPKKNSLRSGSSSLSGTSPGACCRS